MESKKCETRAREGAGCPEKGGTTAARRVRIRWTAAMESELRRLKPSKSNREVAEIFGTTPGAIAAKCNNLGIRLPRHPARIVLAEEQKLWLRLNFPHMSNGICALRLGVSERTVCRMARQYRLEKTPQFMAECRAHTARKAKESHLRNGTYPPKGLVNGNLAKGAPFRFKPKTSAP